MIFPPKTNFCRKKLVLWSKTIFLPRKKLVFGTKTIFLPMKKLLVFPPKTNFFFGEIQKTKQSLFFPRKTFGSFAQSHPFPRKQIGLSAQNQIFPRNKLVFPPKTIFSLGKSWFFQFKAQDFPRKSLCFTTFFLTRASCLYVCRCVHALYGPCALHSVQ